MLNRQEIKNKLYELLDEIGAIETDEEGIEIPDEYLVSELFENDEHMIDIIEQLIKK